MHDETRERLETVETTDDRINVGEYDEYVSNPDDGLARVLSRQLDQTVGVEEGRNFAVIPLAFETFTTNGTADDTETFGLSYDLIDSTITSDPIAVAVDDGAAVTFQDPDAVDYAADSFDFTDSGTDNTLAVWYAAGDQARYVVQKRGPNGTVEELAEFDAGLHHRRNRFENPLRFNFERELQGIVPRRFRIESLIDAPYTSQVYYDGSERVRAPNAEFSVPVRRAQSKIPGVARAVRHDIAES